MEKGVSLPFSLSLCYNWPNFNLSLCIHTPAQACHDQTVFSCLLTLGSATWLALAMACGWKARALLPSLSLSSLMHFCFPFSPPPSLGRTCLSLPSGYPPIPRGEWKMPEQGHPSQPAMSADTRAITITYSFHPLSFRVLLCGILWKMINDPLYPAEEMWIFLCKDLKAPSIHLGVISYHSPHPPSSPSTDIFVFWNYRWVKRNLPTSLSPMPIIAYYLTICHIYFKPFLTYKITHKVEVCCKVGNSIPL